MKMRQLWTAEKMGNRDKWNKVLKKKDSTVVALFHHNHHHHCCCCCWNRNCAYFDNHIFLYLYGLGDYLLWNSTIDICPQCARGQCSQWQRGGQKNLKGGLCVGQVVNCMNWLVKVTSNTCRIREKLFN